MNFICPITNKIIMPKQEVRIIFLEAITDYLFPFMNQMAFDPSEDFTPLGTSFKATFEDNGHEEIFSFSTDHCDSFSSAKEVLLSYVRENALSKKELEEKKLLNHWSEEVSFGSLDTLEELFYRIINASVYFNNNNFITAMIIPEKVYQTLLKHSNFNDAVKEYNSQINSKKWKEKIKSRENLVNELLEELENKRGTYSKFSRTEEVIVDDKIIDNVLKDYEDYKNSDNSEHNDIYEGIKKDIISSKGQLRELRLRREYFVDQQLIDSESDKILDLFMTPHELEIAKKIASLNPKNKLVSDIVEDNLIKNKFVNNIESVIEILNLEYYFQRWGLIFRPNRRSGNYISRDSKALFKDLFS